MIEVIHVNKSFDNNPVLKDVSATFQPGQTNMIIGKSGSGKTVLMKCIIGLHSVDSGKILLNGQNLTEMTFQEIKILRQKVGMLFQGSALFDSSTVLENVLYPLEMFSSMSKAEQIERASFCLHRVNIDPKAFSLSPSEISGGMQKRVAIARAISMNPLYLFCDEPNSGLDPQTSLIIDQLIHEITEEFKITTVINSHDMNSVMEIGDNIIFIEKGEKSWQGHRSEIFDTGNKALEDFVFASDLYKKVKLSHSLLAE